MNNKDMLGRTAILPLAKAQTILEKHLSSVPSCPAESITLTHGLNRVLASTIHASENLPPHPRSTMDGYAVKAQDSFGASESMPVYLTISGNVSMGDVSKNGPKDLECFQIATGGFLPPGTDAVVMLEHTISVDQALIELTKSVAVGENVLGVGDDLTVGEMILAAGKKLRPQEIGLLAGLGHTKISVHKQVKIGLFSTGDELVAYHENPSPGKIRDMNGAHLWALAQQLGALPTHYGIAKDTEKSFTHLLQLALAENDLVLFSGSSSVGVRDMGEKMIEQLAKPGIILHGVAIKPGKPVIAALAGSKPIFGLPGHPVSAAVAFDLFVRPTIVHLAGLKETNLPTRRSLTATLVRNLNSAAGRTDYLRVRLDWKQEEVKAYPVLGKSGALSPMVEADGFIVIPESSQGLRQGDEVEVFLFD